MPFICGGVGIFQQDDSAAQENVGNRKVILSTKSPLSIYGILSPIKASSILKQLNTAT